LGRFWRNLARWCSSTLLTDPTVNNFKFWKSKTATAAILKIAKLPYLGRNFKNSTWRLRHLENSKNRDISAAVWAISTKFGIVMQFHPLDRSDCWKLKILKIQAEIWYVNWYAQENLTWMNTWRSSIDCRCSYLVSQVWAFMFVVHTSNCHGQNCIRRAIFRLGIDTLIANILVLFMFIFNVNILMRLNDLFFGRTCQNTLLCFLYDAEVFC